MKEYQPVSSQEFIDTVNTHKENHLIMVEKSLPTNIVEIVHKTSERTRKSLHIKPEDTVVILGEQTYGLNEKAKVIGKRLLATSASAHGLQPLEMFASYDVVGSEGGIYRMQVPSPHSKDGFASVNILSGWRNGKNRATSGFRSPSSEELQSSFETVKGLYGAPKSEKLLEYMLKRYKQSKNYAEANMQILRDFENQIGLEIKRNVTENTLDTQIAINGGMEVMLHLWPKIISIASSYSVDGVRVPGVQETPFYLYHNGDCMGRMESRFLPNEKIGMETPIMSRCMHCGHEETSTAGDIIEKEGKSTWRAIPRVIAYSTLGIADGHITGGGSVYNEVAETVSNSIGIPYFPIIHMSKSIGNGGREGIFDYQSSAIGNKGQSVEKATNFVIEGNASMVDLILSIGVDQLKQSIAETLESGVYTDSRVKCPEPLPKYKSVIKV